MLQIAASAILFVGLGARACSLDPRNLPALPTATCHSLTEEERDSDDDRLSIDRNSECTIHGEIHITLGWGANYEEIHMTVGLVLCSKFGRNFLKLEVHAHWDAVQPIPTGNSRCMHMGMQCNPFPSKSRSFRGKPDTVENVEDEELKGMLESWKSKTFALTVPLRVVALRGSIPPTWIKDFIQSQGKRLKFRLEFRGALNDIFSDLSSSLSKGNLNPKTAMAADIVSVGDSWLSLGINKGIIEPMEDVEGQDWFKGLSEKWKVYLRRNSDGQLDTVGKIWAAPYRWGSMVIAYKKNKFQKHNIPPIEDWEDLWRPELAGKISMIDSPREVIGAVLKYMGASYNTKDIDSQVTGGRNAALQNLLLLQQQVRLFDSVHYLKAFGVGDVWVAVGWSSDVLPAAKRMSNVAVVVPKSGASLWADLWAIPAASRFTTDRIGGRVRGPSPLIHQWMEFCLQAARALPFQQEVIPGSSPFALEDPPVEGFQDFKNGKPKLDTNLISGVPPSEILAKCEFLEPLTEATLLDYQWLIDNMQKPGRGLINNMQYYISSMVQSFRLKPNLR
ncbi:Bacterial periplasmic spermidine/putrescine-binding protein [Macleaya cordata]|uniref:Bacterial periplasmic spermidine/putrescine-binding protein n=1 Tax=Macleaya cordata TaxID=56857 RepID=A0A200R6Q7_MACCD|nr:Bacterial periplasmic spermidine/putrescine-binding protein [Macleaya cordata]